MHTDSTGKDNKAGATGEEKAGGEISIKDIRQVSKGLVM